MFCRFLKVTIATSNFMNEVYNGGFLPEFIVSRLREIIALVWDYVYETRKYKAKTSSKNISETEIWNLSAMKH